MVDFKASPTLELIADAAEADIYRAVTAARFNCKQKSESEFEAYSLITRRFAKMMFARLSVAKKQEGFPGEPDPGKFIQACMDGVEDFLNEDDEVES